MSQRRDMGHPVFCGASGNSRSFAAVGMAELRSSQVPKCEGPGAPRFFQSHSSQKTVQFHDMLCSVFRDMLYTSCASGSERKECKGRCRGRRWTYENNE